MQQLRFNGGIDAHCQREPSLWPGQPSRALDELAPHGAELLELPQRCALFSCISFFFKTAYLHFPVEVMRQHGRLAALTFANCGCHCLGNDRHYAWVKRIDDNAIRSELAQQICDGTGGHHIVGPLV